MAPTTFGRNHSHRRVLSVTIRDTRRCDTRERGRSLRPLTTSSQGSHHLNAFSALTIALEPASLLVAGFGDPARADDMAGLLVAHRLSEAGAGSADVWLEGQSPSLPELASRNQVVIVDSVITGAPGGTIHLARFPGPRLTPRSFRKDPAHMKALEQIDGAAFLIGIEIESLRSDALPSETVLEAVEWLSGNFDTVLKIFDVMDDACVRLAPPTFFPRRFRLY